MIANPQNPSPRTLAAVRLILSVFETGKKHGDPSALAVLRDGAGISYGLHQATHRAGSLCAVLLAYATLQPAREGETLRYANLLKNRTPANVTAVAANSAFREWLRTAGQDPLMRAAQEEVFARGYMAPAVSAWRACEFAEPLSLAVVYDAHIQGGWAACRARTNARHAQPVGEREWVSDYLSVREDYLLSLPSKDQKASVYRPRVFRALVKAENWALATPFNVRGVTVVEEDLV